MAIKSKALHKLLYNIFHSEEIDYELERNPNKDLHSEDVLIWADSINRNLDLLGPILTNTEMGKISFELISEFLHQITVHLERIMVLDNKEALERWSKSHQNILNDTPDEDFKADTEPTQDSIDREDCNLNKFKSDTE